MMAQHLKRDDEAYNTVIRTEPCPKCGSSDNVKRYADGHAHCYSGGCDYYEKGSGGDVGGADSYVPKEKKAETRMLKMLAPSSDDAFRDLSKRSLHAATLRRFGYFLGQYGDESSAHIYTVFDQRGNAVRQKVRLKDKNFAWIKLTEDAPSHQECQLFNINVWGERNDKRVVVTTGELDTMSVSEATDFKIPCVSIIGGDDSAFKECQANYRWLDRFEEIVLYFDNDESGQKAAIECASLFQVGKVKLAKVEGFKDASELKQAKRPGDISAAIYGATVWRPDGVVNAADCLEDMFDESALTPTYTYKWGFLNDMVKGLYKGQVVYFVAGTGMGKTTFIFDQEIDWLRQGAKIGHCGFEDMRADVQIGLLSAKLGRRLILQPLPREELIKAHTELFGDRKVELFDPETAQWGMESVFKYIRYMVKALECDVIIVDPLSFIAAGVQGEDPVRALDGVAQRLSLLAKEMGCHIIISHHLKRPEGDTGHEDGAQISLSQLRGSGSLAHFASTAVGIEGDQQGDNSSLRTIRVIKNRKIGPTGVAGQLSYDVETGVFSEVNNSNKRQAVTNDY